MNEAELAGLKRKHAATEEIAKKQELAHQLRQAGVDPETGEKMEMAPFERTGPRVIKTVQEAPADADGSDKSKPSATKAASGSGRPARAAKGATSK